jgi:nucleotide sugar dehydrogenase
LKITVVALGKIGLPLAVQFASMGHEVIGADVNVATVATVNAGQEPFPGEAGLQEALSSAVAAGRLRATTATAAAVAESEAVVVVVPLAVDADGLPDFSLMDLATRDIGAGLQPGTLVSYETTLPVGTTRTRFAVALAETSGLASGRDFHVVFSPERVLTGRVFSDLRRYPKLVGGLDEEGTKRGVAFYESVLTFDERADLTRPNGVWDLGTAEAAEMAKLAETTFRDVNIGLANQFARFAEQSDIDIYQVIEACNSQPYSHIHTPGIAVGGHCIPVYPRLYLWNDPDATIVRAARAANAAMPEHAIDVLEKAYGDLNGARVVVLGVAYRAGAKETAFSGVFPLATGLRTRGATPLVHDPLYTDEELVTLGFEPFHIGEPVDAAVVHTGHPDYRTLSARDLPGVRVLVDGRRITDPELWPDVQRRVVGQA